jgi:chemotaxis protein CheX
MNFINNNLPGIVSIKILKDINQEIAKDLCQEFDKCLMKDPSVSNIVLHMGDSFTIDNAGFRLLSLGAIELRKKQKTFFLVDVCRELKLVIHDMGLNSLFKIIESIGEVQRPIVKSKKIDVNFLNPFIEATLNTLKVQCGYVCKPLKPTLKDASVVNLIDIAGVIGITSPTFNGSISICFPEKIFLRIMSNMLGEEFTEINKDLEDGAGELLNIIFGFAKRVLNEGGHSFEKAIPTIVRGKGMSIKHLSDYPCFLLPFESADGLFYIEIASDNIS